MFVYVNVNNVLYVNVMIYILFNCKCSLVFFLVGIKVIIEKWLVKCKINFWNEWNVICIFMVNFFFINFYDLFLFVNFLILFMKI